MPYSKSIAQNSVGECKFLQQATIRKSRIVRQAGTRSNKQAKAHAEKEYTAFAEKRRKMIEAEAERINIKTLEDKEKGGQNE